MLDTAQKENKEENKITVGKAAEILGVSSSTLRRLESAHRISSQREANGHRSYLKEDVFRLKEELSHEKVLKVLNDPDKDKNPQVTNLQTTKNDTKLEIPKREEEEKSPAYLNSKKRLRLVSAGFILSSFFLLALFTYKVLSPIKSKDRWNTSNEKNILSNVLGTRTKNPQYQVELNVSTIANKDLAIKGGLQVENGVGIKGNTDIQGNIALSTEAKSTLENLFEMAGDVEGTLRSASIKSLGGLTIKDIPDNSGNLLYIEDGKITSGVLSDLDTTDITELGAISSGSWEADPIIVDYGGTGLISYNKGDLIYASAKNTLKNLTIGTEGYILTSASGVPIWKDVNTTLGGNVFLQGGNSFGQTASIGTTDNYPLEIITNNLRRLTVTNTGNIGIGGNLVIDSSGDINLKGEDLYSEVLGNRTYTAQRYITNGETISASIDALDLVVQDVVSGELGLWKREAGSLIHPATYSNFVITDSGKVGIGTSSPSETLDVKGSAIIGNTSSDTINLVARIKAGTSIIPEVDIGSDLGAENYRFNNIYVANINSNTQLTSTGQAIFTYEPKNTSYAESSVRINPTSPTDNSFLLGLGIHGYQKAGIDSHGDLSIGYADLESIPPSDNPFNVYGHNGTIISQIDTSGNGYFAGTLGLGTSSPSALLHVVGETEQLRLSYDGSNYTSFDIDSDGELTISDTGLAVAKLGALGANFSVPVNYESAGDVSIANNLIFTNTTSSTIKSYGPLYLEGESFRNDDLTLKSYGTGNIVANIQGTGFLRVLGADPSIVFDTKTAVDTDFWAGIVEDAGGDDDDVLSIGKGTILGTGTLITIDGNGKMGVGISPTEKLHVSGNILSTGTISNSSLTLSTAGITSTGGISLKLADSAGSNSLAIKDSSDTSLFSVSSLGEISSSGTTANFTLNGGGSGNAFTITNTGTGLSLKVNDTSGDTTPFVIDADGNTGIGVSSPSTKLHVLGTSTQLRLGYDSSNYADFAVSNGGLLTISGAGTSVLINDDLSTTGNLSLKSGKLLVMDSDDSADSYLAHSSGDNSRIGLWIDGTEVIRFKYDGSVDANGTVTSNAFDLAETYPTLDQELAPGHVVMIADKLKDEKDTSGEPFVTRADYLNRDKVVGIVSTKPGFTLGGGSFGNNDNSNNTTSEVMVALAGRVPLKVNLDNGEIKEGDPLTIGIQPGVATKANTEGMIVGRALESLSKKEFDEGKNVIVTMLQVSWWKPTMDLNSSSPRNLGYFDETQVSDLLSSGQNAKEDLEKVDLQLNSLMVLGAATFSNITATGNVNVGNLKIDSLNNSIGIVGPSCYSSSEEDKDLCLSQTLFIQKELVGNVDILEGALVIKPSGDVEVKGNLTAQKLIASEYVIKSDQDSTSMGSDSLKTGESSVKVESKFVKDDSKIMITPTSDTEGRVLFVSEKKSGEYFVVKLSLNTKDQTQENSLKEIMPLDKDITFDWWILNTED